MFSSKQRKGLQFLQVLNMFLSQNFTKFFHGMRAPLKKTQNRNMFLSHNFTNDLLSTHNLVSITPIRRSWSFDHCGNLQCQKLRSLEKDRKNGIESEKQTWFYGSLIKPKAIDEDKFEL